MRRTTLLYLFAGMICLTQIIHAAPSDLSAFYDDEIGQVTLNWTDNPSDPDEDGFLIQRQLNDNAWNDEYASVAQGVTTYGDSIEGDGTYRYRVVGFWAGEGGPAVTTAPTNTVEVVIDHSPPEAPSNLQYAIVNGTDIQLTWTDNSTSEGYFMVERAIDAGAFVEISGYLPVGTTSYSDESLTPGHTYQYHVKAGNSFGASDFSNTISVLLAENINAPSSLSALVSGNRVDLSWTDNSANETGFVLERKIDNGVFQVLNNTLTADVVEYADEALQTQHTYAYRIYAYNNGGNSDYSNTASAYVDLATYSLTLQSIAEVDDSFLSPLDPDQNYGASASVDEPDLRYIFKFNFPPVLTNKRIIKAELRIQGWDHSGTWTPNLYMDMYRVSRSWDESEVTWDDALDNTPWNIDGGDYDKTIGQVQIASYDEGTGQVDSPVMVSDPVAYPPADITDIVKRWVRNEIANNGLLLVNETLYHNNFMASENSVHPYLVVTYMNECDCDYSADFNYDCRVNLNDFAEMASHWQQASSALDIAPAGGDGLVDLADLKAFADQWLSECDGSMGGEEEGE